MKKTETTSSETREQYSSPQLAIIELDYNGIICGSNDDNDVDNPGASGTPGGWH